MSDRETVDFLAGVPLLAGRDEADLAELARVMRRRTVQEGETLWRQGDDPRELALIVDGTVSASVQVTGGRAAEIGRSGRGEIVGLIGVLDGEGHATSVRVTETATLLALGRLDFAALLAGQQPLGVQAEAPPRDAPRRAPAQPAGVPRRLARRRVGRSARPGGREDLRRTGGRPRARQPVRPPDGDVPRLRSAGALGLPDLRALCPLPAGPDAARRGAPSTAYYLTINGAVEKVIVRGDRRIRVGLAGPGKAFGYESLIDGRPSPVTAITRERALLLVVPRDLFGQLFNGEDAVSRGFLDVIQKDLMATLRETLRPCARLAASR